MLFPFLADGELIGFCNSRPRGMTIAISPSPRVSTRCDTACSRSTATTWVSARIATTRCFAGCERSKTRSPSPQAARGAKRESAGTSHPAVLLLARSLGRSLARRFPRWSATPKRTHGACHSIETRGQGTSGSRSFNPSSCRRGGGRGLTWGMFRLDRASPMRNQGVGHGSQSPSPGLRRPFAAQIDDDARFLAHRALDCLWDRAPGDRGSPGGRQLRVCSKRSAGSPWSRAWRSGSGSGLRSGRLPSVCTTSRLRRRYALGVRLITFLSLVVYGWIIHSVGWSKMVRTNWGLGGVILFDDFVVFLPFRHDSASGLVGVVLRRAGLSQSGSRVQRAGWADTWCSRGRQSLGLTLPVILLYVVGRDVIGGSSRAGKRTSLGEPIEIAVLGPLVLSLSPLFVRLAWPTCSLPPGAVAPAARARSRPGRLSLHRYPGLGYREHDGQRLRDRHLAAFPLCLADRCPARFA